jgi:regulator of RNase E activity RraA
MARSTVGFRVFTQTRRPPRALLERLAALTLPNIADIMHVSGVLGPAIRPIVGTERRIAGPAVTVKARSGDILMIVEAMKVAQPGDVLVVTNGAQGDQCIWGGLMSAMAVDCGIVGFVSDGYVRDLEEMRATGIAVFAAGFNALAPTKEGPGEVNVPIAVGGVVVNPGDVVVADQEGVVIVPLEHAEDICAKAEAMRASDARRFQDIAAHRWKEAYFRAADEIVLKKGGSIVDGPYQPER